MSLNHELKENGFVLFGSDKNQSSICVANSIGKVFRVESMPLVQTLTPREMKNEKKSTYSGNFGKEMFPFHTDLAHWYRPPRYLMLRCIVPAKEVYTGILHGNSIFKDESPVELKKALFKPRRRLDNKSYFLRLFQEKMIRWDTLFIRPANSMAEKVQERILEKLADTEFKKVFFELPGETILLDNWKVLHCRSQVPLSAHNRKIERIYLEEVIF